jgi:hypothetical protein
MRKTLSIATSLAVLITACGDDDPSGPTIPNVAGSWTYSATNITGGGVTCSFTNVPMTLAQTGTTFTGAYAGGLLACAGPGGSFSEQVAGGSVATGTINGNAVTFDLDNSDWHNTGTISGATMSGTVVVKINDGTTTFTLAGEFTATRQ